MSVVRNRLPGSTGSITEHWTSESPQAIQDLFQQEVTNYPTGGYGTMLTGIHADPTGLLWHARFYRMASCD
jgi:hypothetical protein